MSAAEPIGKRTAIVVHEVAIARFGGAAGIRDEGLLEAALAQPWQSFGGIELYPTIEEKAARLAFEIISQHPFVDGNKRTAAALMRALLAGNGITFKPRRREWFNILVAVGSGESDYNDLLSFTKENTTQRV